MSELLSGPAGILRIDPLRLDMAPALATGTIGHDTDGTLS